MRHSLKLKVTEYLGLCRKLCYPDRKKSINLEFPTWRTRRVPGGPRLIPSRRGTTRRCDPVVLRWSVRHSPQAASSSPQDQLITMSASIWWTARWVSVFEGLPSSHRTIISFLFRLQIMNPVSGGHGTVLLFDCIKVNVVVCKANVLICHHYLVFVLSLTVTYMYIVRVKLGSYRTGNLYIYFLYCF